MRTISVPVSHNLPKEEVRRRMRERVGSLDSYIPGNTAIKSGWPSEDRMTLDITAMGQTIPATLDIEERAVIVTVALPGMLGMVAGAIESTIREKGPKLLLGDQSKDNQDKDREPGKSG